MASRKRKLSPKKNLDHEDSITLLNAAVAFKRQNHGAVPSLSTIKPVYDSIKDSLHRRLDINQTANRINRLKQSYRTSLLSGKVPASPSHRVLFDLSREVWGPMKPLRERSKNEDGKKFVILGEQMGMYLEREKLGVGILEEGLRFADKSKAGELEKRWKRLLLEELNITANCFELKSEICEALDDDKDDEDEGEDL